MTRIGIDCRLGGITHAGIGRYIQNLVSRLPRLDSKVEWVLFFASQQQAEQVMGELVTAVNVKIVLAPITHYTLAEQLKLPSIFGAEKLDLLHVPHFNIPILYGGKLIVTIHDLLWHEYRGTHVTTLKPWKYWLKYWAYRLVATLAIFKATQILVPAQTIKNTVAKYYPRVADKVVVTTEGVEDRLISPGRLTTNAVAALSPQLQKVIKKHDTILLYVGSLYPHKNVAVVLKALSQLPDYQFVIVGSRSVFQDEVRTLVEHLNVSKQVTFAGFVPDEELSTLFAASTALVQPSFSEGFGLTGLEALAAGVPLLASDIPIFKEIYQDGAIYFNPASPAAFCAAVKELKKSSKSELKLRGQAIANQYSWQTMAQQTVHAYRSILNAARKQS